MKGFNCYNTFATEEERNDFMQTKDMRQKKKTVLSYTIINGVKYYLVWYNRICMHVRGHK